MTLQFTLGEVRICDIIAELARVEHWRQVDAYPEYEVSTHGRVRRGPKILKPYPRDGYACVTLYGDGKKQRLPIHRLVALAFLGPEPFEGALVAHRDGVRANARIDNLRWASFVENLEDMNRHNTRLRGSSVGAAKLREHQIPTIREMIAAGVNYPTIGAQFGVSPDAIFLIAKNKTWKHAIGAQGEAV